jgi:TatD DNase family protein
VPLESLLLETDCPVPFNKQPSRPAWIKEVALKVAALKEIPLLDLEKRLEKNALALFGKI